MAPGAPRVGASKGLCLLVYATLLPVSLNYGKKNPGAASCKRAAPCCTINKKGVGPAFRCFPAGLLPNGAAPPVKNGPPAPSAGALMNGRGGKNKHGPRGGAPAYE
ncbi:hypothetical protein NDU88_002714 [Pleurodeles waltl]|uniref:Uncharacterized protein n=1 Tax=Pleurodeles waltl TaxID=8319 RepID=A0AAV7Q9P1_PLEWA|nr:hypothetical protein NDU88_002714 [Pleurodeles waltl]